MIRRSTLHILIWLVLGAHAEDFRWEISLRGNRDFSTDKLLEQLAIPEEFSGMDAGRRDLVMHIARNNLEDFYRAKGYFNVRISLEWGIRRDRVWEYIFHIDEGERFRFRHTDIQIIPADTSLVPESRLAVAKGGFFDFDELSGDLQILRNAYLRQGFLHVRVDHYESVDLKDRAVDVQFTVRPGAQALMGKISAQITRSGQNSTPGLTDPQWLTDLWELDSGQIVDGTYLTRFRSRLLSTQIFNRIHITDTLRQDGSGLSDIVIRAVERVPGEARLSTFYEESDGFGLGAYLRHRNLGGNFQEGNGKLTLAQNRQELILGYANPLLLGTSLHWIPTAIRFDDQLIFSHEKLPLPEDPDSLEERYELANRGELSFGLSSRIRSRSAAEIRYIDRHISSGLRLKTETGLAFDYGDNPFEPVRGWRGQATLGIGRAFRGGWRHLQVSAPYPYVQLRNAFYYPLYGPLLTAVALDHGRFFAAAPDDEARVFYQGGSRSLRGYRFRSVFPSRLADAPPPDTGKILEPGLTPAYWRVSGELRLNLPARAFKNFQLVQFLDWTRISDQDPSYTPAEEAALGSGLRYRWKVLTLRLDYTWKKNFRRWELEPFSLSRLTFDLSQAF